LTGRVHIPDEIRGLILADIPVQMRRTGYSLNRILEWFGIKRSVYYDWLKSRKRPTEAPLAPPATVVRVNGITPEEEQKVIRYRREHPDVGYRKLTWMMVDEDAAYLSESSVYNILSAHGMLYGWARPDSEGAEKEYRHKPKYPHHHWHTDIAYIKIRNVFYFLIMLLDGFSRFLLDWELMTDMTGPSVELFIQRAKEKYPYAHPMLIHDNGSQFISHDFKRLVTRLEIQSVPTRRNHPETNGKIERMNKTVKSEAIRPNSPFSYAEAGEILNEYGYQYNYQRLHAGINYLRPADMFFERGNKILRERNQKMLLGRQLRKQVNLERKTAA